MDCQNASGFSNRTIVCCFDDGCYSSDPRARYNSAVCCGDTGNTAQCTAPPADAPHPSTSARRLQQDDRRIEEAFAYGDSLLGTRYGWWTGGAIPLRAPAWSAQGPPPAAKEVKDSTCFCAGVPNLMLRKIGAKVPCWEGEGCGGTGAYGKYFASVLQPFNLSAEYPRGTLVGRCKQPLSDFQERLLPLQSLKRHSAARRLPQRERAGARRGAEVAQHTRDTYLREQVFLRVRGAAAALAQDRRRPRRRRRCASPARRGPALLGLPLRARHSDASYDREYPWPC